MSREQVFAAFFFAVFLFLLYQLYLLFSGYLAPLAWASLLAIVFYPLQVRLVRWLRGRQSLAAFLLTTAVIGGVIIPTLIVVALVASESVLLYERVTAFVASGGIGRLQEWLGNSVLRELWEWLAPLAATWKIDLASIGVKTTNAVSAFLVSQATGIAKNIAGFLVDFFLCTVALFFLLRDGERMLAAFKEILPMEREHREMVLERFADTLTAVVQGTLLTALAQGLLAGLGYVVLGVPFAVFLGCATALLALIPMGTPVAWGAVAMYLFATGETARGVIQLLWGTFVISTVDNFIRPLVIGGRTRIPTIVLFFAILGGLQVYGFLGLFLAPAVIALLVAFARIYREQYGLEAVGATADVSGEQD